MCVKGVERIKSDRLKKGKKNKSTHSLRTCTVTHEQQIMLNVTQREKANKKTSFDVYIVNMDLILFACLFVCLFIFFSSNEMKIRPK